MSAAPVEQQPGDWVAEASPGVGERLRAAREARRLTVADVAQALKLGVRQVEALEGGNWASLPGTTFIRGFVRNYARLLQVDAAPLMAQLGATVTTARVNLDVPENASGAMPAARSAVQRHNRGVVILGALLLAGAGLAYMLLPDDLAALRDKAQGMIDGAARKEDKATETVAAPAAKEPAVAEPAFPPGQTPEQVINPQSQALPQLAPAPAAPAAAVAGTGALGLAFKGDSWVEVKDRDGKVLLSERRTVGGDQAVDGAAPLTVTVGKASAVALTWRGKAVDLAPHTKGEVARLTLE
jgi:cytoskeleton protein RodZ